MSTKQYTITERNNHEQETFGYVMNLTDSEVKVIEEKIQVINFYKSKPITIVGSNETPETIKSINDRSENSYMDRLGFYEFESNDTLVKWDNFGDLFYKGLGLKEVDFKDINV